MPISVSCQRVDLHLALICINGAAHNTALLGRQRNFRCSLSVDDQHPLADTATQHRVTVHIGQSDIHIPVFLNRAGRSYLKIQPRGITTGNGKCSR